MSYTSINRCANDAAFIARVQACAAQQGQADPIAAAQEWRWPIAAHPLAEAAYEAAIQVSNPAPGADPTVITDAMILEAVNKILDPVGGTPPIEPPIEPPIDPDLLPHPEHPIVFPPEATHPIVLPEEEP